jgi:hypothetical protein
VGRAVRVRLTAPSHHLQPRQPCWRGGRALARRDSTLMLFALLASEVEWFVRAASVPASLTLTVTPIQPQSMMVMDLDALLVRYFGTADLATVSEDMFEK